MKKQQGSLVALGAGQLSCYLFLLSLGNLREQVIPCLAGFFGAFLLYGASLLTTGILRVGITAEHRSDHRGRFYRKEKFALVSILCFSLFFRAAMWAGPSSLSDDIYRYVWEGKLLASGINPFHYAPDDPALESWRDPEIYPNINHKSMSAIYPPLSLFIFSLATVISPTVPLMKTVFVFFDVLTILTLVLTVRALSLDATRVIVYAWNPVVIMEFSGSGHLDSAGVFFLVLALYLLMRRKTVWTTLSLSLSFLIKLLPALFLPFVLKTRRVRNVLLFAMVGIIFYVPFLNAGSNLVRSLTAYGERWAFNGSLYALFLWMLHSPWKARVVSAALFTGVIALLLIRHKISHPEDQEKSLYSVGFVMLGSLFMLTPVLHPWYLCWIVPFLVVRPNRAWILLTGTVFLSYWVLKGYHATGVWAESTVIRLVEYLPFYFLLIGDFLRNKVASERS